MALAPLKIDIRPPRRIPPVRSAEPGGGFYALARTADQNTHPGGTHH